MKRIIIDGRPYDLLFPNDEPCDLPHIREVVETICGWTWAWATDLSNYFHQFPLRTGICIVVKGPEGRWQLYTDGHGCPWGSE